MGIFLFLGLDKGSITGIVAIHITRFGDEVYHTV